ncbi:hypothetical protein O3G_MSEX009069 [Manduca sexta]|uniref:Uncharacterized protein n=1 Tax=Manduca sexta TaxID=7130 RepID=A0A922CQW7_MANSE|nr:hypothetical protein O3G_MSEX009069 [Manduca sexta]
MEEQNTMSCSSCGEVKAKIQELELRLAELENVISQQQHTINSLSSTPQSHINVDSDENYTNCTTISAPPTTSHTTLAELLADPFGERFDQHNTYPLMPNTDGAETPWQYDTHTYANIATCSTSTHPPALPHSAVAGSDTDGNTTGSGGNNCTQNNINHHTNINPHPTVINPQPLTQPNTATPTLQPPITQCVLCGRIIKHYNVARHYRTWHKSVPYKRTRGAIPPGQKQYSFTSRSFQKTCPRELRWPLDIFLVTEGANRAFYQCE